MAKKSKGAQALAASNGANQGNGEAKPAITRTRAFLRSYDYETGKGVVKDANSSLPIVDFDVSQFPPSVQRKLALTGAMALIAAKGVEAVRDKEPTGPAMSQMIEDLREDKVEFRDGVGISMGGTLKKVARALVELNFTYVMAPTGQRITWEAGNLADAYAAMKTLWGIPEDKERTGEGQRKESGRACFNRVKLHPDVAAKLTSYEVNKGKGVDLG